MTKAILAGCLVSLGMLGLYFKVEYAGWVVFIGLLVALDS